jgi:hypothetical protein
VKLSLSRPSWISSWLWISSLALLASAPSACGRVPALHRDAAPVVDAAPVDGSGESQVTPDGPTDDTVTPDAATASPDDASDGRQPREASVPCEGGTCQGPSVPGVVFWLDGTEGVHLDDLNRVQHWDDRSGHGHDGLTFNFATRPLFDATGANGRPLLTFDKVNGRVLYIEDDPSLNWGFEDFTLMVVAASSNPAVSPGTFFRRNLKVTSSFEGEGRLGIQLADDIDVSTTQGGYNNGALLLFTARRIGRHTVELRVNGESSLTKEVRELDVGDISRAYMGESLQGGLAEVIGLVGPLSPADLEAMETYLLHKYGIR